MASTTKAQWGVKGTVGTITGVVTDLSVSRESMLGTQQNEVGSVIQQSLYDKKTTMTATIEVPAGTSLPDFGAQITIGGVAGYVTSASIQENNTSYRKISVTAEKYERCSAVTPAMD